MTLFRFATASTFKLGRRAGGRVIGSSSITDWELATIKVIGNASHCMYGGCGSAPLLLAPRSERSEGDEHVRNFHDPGILSSGESSKSLHSLHLFSHSSLCSTTPCNSLTSLFRNELGRCSLVSMTPGRGLCALLTLKKEHREARRRICLKYDNLHLPANKEPPLSERHRLFVPQRRVSCSELAAAKPAAASHVTPEKRFGDKPNTLSFSWRSVRNVRNPTANDKRSSSSHFPLLSVSIATALILPLTQDQEGSSHSDTIRSAATRPVCARESDVTDCVTGFGRLLREAASQAHFHRQLLPHIGTVFIGAADAVQELFSSVRQLIVADTVREGSGKSKGMHGNLQHLQWGFQQLINLLASGASQDVRAHILYPKKVFSICSRSTHEDRPEVGHSAAIPSTATRQQHPLYDGAEAKQNESLSSLGFSSHVDQPAVQEALKTEGRQETTKDRIGLEHPGHLWQQAEDLTTDATHRQPNVTDKAVGWFTALARAIVATLQTLASVCQRLLLVVPLALAAATAGFWLLLLPHVSTCLQLVGVGRHRAVLWEAAAQHELEEVIFTSITVAASAAGPTYVKFLQVTCFMQAPLIAYQLIVLLVWHFGN